MPAIQLSNNTTLNVTASSADENATLNRYLTNPLSFITPAVLNAIGNQKVGDLDPTAFPITASATGAGQFAVEGTSLGIKVGESASVGLLTGADAKDFFDSVSWPQDPTAANLISFGLQGTLSTGDTANVSDFTFGVTKNATVQLTSFYPAAGTDTFVDAVKRAIAALTSPHDLNDLESLPPNTACQIDASSSLQFTASVTYSILNDPLATKSIPNLPAITVNATAGATLEGTATHTADHTITIAKLANGLLHLSVDLTKTDDLETSLTVSAGVTANVGTQDALASCWIRLVPIPPRSSKRFRRICRRPRLSSSARTSRRQSTRRFPVRCKPR
ncbi:MAG: hypothetical protein ABSB35_06995 [Bryobacteraceae bacterium]|jgi:hypothetical protein